MGDTWNSRVQFELISSSSDHRLQFPRALLRQLLFGEKIRFEDFVYISGRWKQNFDLFVAPASATRELAWDQKTTLILEDGKILCRIRATSREGFLLRLLADGPRSRSVLMSALWPEISDSELLEDRLEKLIKRLGGKIDTQKKSARDSVSHRSISLEGGIYRVNVRLRRI